MNAIQKPLFSKCFMKHFKDFSIGLVELQAELNEDTVFDFAIHHRQNKTLIQKISHVKNNACSQCDVTW
jgi:hypothetical protein